MNGTPALRAMSRNVPAVSSAIWRDSTTQGPAIRNSGLSRPTSNPQSLISGGDSGLRLPRLVLQRGLDERREQRMPGARRRRELRVELAADEPRMAGQLDHLAQLLALRQARHAQPLVLQPLDVLVVDLVAVPVPLVDGVGAVDLARERCRLERGRLRTEAHGAAEIGFLGAPLDASVAVLPLGDERDHRVRGVGLELGAVRAGETDDVARELDHRELHPEADAEVRDAVL